MPITGISAGFTNKIHIAVDLGQARGSVWRSEKLRDEKGNPVEFNSIIDALNWFGAGGWEFVQTYVTIDDGDSTSYWLLKRDVSGLTEEEKAAILSKLRTTR